MGQRGLLGGLEGADMVGGCIDVTKCRSQSGR